MRIDINRVLFQDQPDDESKRYAVRMDVFSRRITRTYRSLVRTGVRASTRITKVLTIALASALPGNHNWRTTVRRSRETRHDREHGAFS